MSIENKNLPAFPPNAGWEHSQAIGLSKREYVAIKAMQGLTKWNDSPGHFEEIAARSVQLADALLVELEK